MRLTFDRGTLLLTDAPPELDLTQIAGILWDARVGAHRAPARLCYPLASELRRRGVQIADMPRPVLEPPAEFRPLALRPYQEAALGAWRQAGRRGVVVLPTGSGKTRLALAAIAATRTPALCLAPTRALCDQWAAALAAVWDGPLGRFGDGERVVGPITIATFA
ncbi:MAG TPA: DEAD/DEAH box helicase family protein, partial [Polyangia bacterium]|nr:DEAD/DEAH box helicase family protein [Polyangia bacterium]